MEGRKLSERGIFSPLLLLEEMFNPNSTRARALRDPVVVSLDLEYKSNPNLIYQIGLSVLDIRHLGSIDVLKISNRLPHWCQIISSYSDDDVVDHTVTDPRLVESLSVEDILRPFLVVKDEKGQPRNVVLVGHTINADLAVGLDLNSLTHIRAYVDIGQTCSQDLGDGIHKMSLKRICQRFGIRTFSYHNAAHDALYTIQALLKLFCLYEGENWHHLTTFCRCLETKRKQTGGCYRNVNSKSSDSSVKNLATSFGLVLRRIVEEGSKEKTISVTHGQVHL